MHQMAALQGALSASSCISAKSTAALSSFRQRMRCAACAGRPHQHMNRSSTAALSHLKHVFRHGCDDGVHRHDGGLQVRLQVRVCVSKQRVQSCRAAQRAWGISESAKTRSRAIRSMVTTVEAPTRTRPTVSKRAGSSSPTAAPAGAAAATAAGSSALIVCTAELSAGRRALQRRGSAPRRAAGHVAL